MAFTLQQLLILEADIATGVSVIRDPSGRELRRYASLKDMLYLRDVMRDELGLNGENNGRTIRYAQHSKGLC